MKEVVGAENCSAVRLHDMEQPFSAAEVYGKVLNIGSDLPAGHIKELSIFKNLTGGDMVEANRKYGKKFKFTSHALNVFSANEISTVGEQSGAYFNRMHPVHFAIRMRLASIRTLRSGWCGRRTGSSVVG